MLTTCVGIHSATSSPGSAAGATRCDWLAGRTIVLSGQDHARASRSAALGSRKGLMTSDTSGHLFADSSPSARLQSALASRLRAALDVNGSPEYSLIWKAWAMPSREPICALRASARRTSGSGCTGLPTAQASNAQGTRQITANRESEPPTGMRWTPNLVDAAGCVQGWQTPNAMDGGSINRGGDRNHELLLGGQLKAIQGWPTTLASDACKRGSVAPRVNCMALPETAACVQGWPTPNCSERGPDSIESKAKRGSGGVDLQTTVQSVSGWATPASRDGKDSPGMATSGTNPDGSERLRVDMLPRQAHGVIADSSPASSQPEAEEPEPSTDARRLNPRFSLWLMGFPEEWACCAERATRSSRKSRPVSSVPTSTGK